MTDTTVTIKRGQDGWRWSLDYRGSESMGRLVYGTMQQAAADAEQAFIAHRQAERRADPRHKEAMALANAAHMGVDQFPPQP